MSQARPYMGAEYEDQGPGITLYPNWRRIVKLARSDAARARALRQVAIDRAILRSLASRHRREVLRHGEETRHSEQ